MLTNERLNVRRIGSRDFEKVRTRFGVIFKFHRLNRSDQETEVANPEAKPSEGYAIVSGLGVRESDPPIAKYRYAERDGRHCVTSITKTSLGRSHDAGKCCGHDDGSLHYAGSNSYLNYDGLGRHGSSHELPFPTMTLFARHA